MIGSFKCYCEIKIDNNIKGFIYFGSLEIIGGIDENDLEMLWG